MSLEKMELPPRSLELKKENPDFQFIQDQLAEAIKGEDYEQAAILRDFIATHGDKAASYELRKKDFVQPNKGGVYIFNENDPKCRVWKGIDEKQQQYFYEGKDKVENSQFADSLTFIPYIYNILEDEDWQRIKSMKDVSGGGKIDFVLNLRSQRDEMKHFVNLASEKFNRLWKPYCEKNGLSGPEFSEVHSLYNKEAELTDDKTKALNKVPENLRESLRYWQRVYDNSRCMLDEFNKALKELE
jgi:hypothetical protein